MADTRSGLIVKTLNAGDVAVKVVDAAGTNELAVTAAGKVNAIVEATDLDIRALDGATDSVAITGSVTVTATDLDIRNLAPATDKVAIGDGTHDLDVNADGSINAVVSATGLDIRALASGTDSVTVVATDLDIRALDGASDSVAITGSVTVTATDLDVRDLTHASDSVKIGDGTDLLAVNGDGSINVVVQTTAATLVTFTDEENVVAQNATETVDYTITDTKVFTGGVLKVGTLGQCKIKVGIWDGAAYVAGKTRVFFQAAGLNPDHSLAFLKHTGDATDTVRVAVTNLDDETNISIAFDGTEL